nr:hypothetical protein [Tanacetum cinerariifolium]
MLVHQGEGSGTPTEPHHTPSPKADTSHPTTSSIPLPSLPTAPIPPVTQNDTTPIRQYSRRARIAQSFALPTVADEPASLVRDVSEGEACPTESGFIADQDRETIAKSSTLPYDSAPRVTSPAADEGSMQQTIFELTALCTSLQRQHSKLLTKFQALEVEILRELEEQQEKEDMRMNEQIARDAEVARIHAEEELQGMIDSQDRTNETIAKYMQEDQDFALELPLEKRIELISDLAKYQENYSKDYKFQSQQRRPMTKKQKRDYYMTMIRNNLGWKVKDFKDLLKQLDIKDLNQQWALVKEYLSIRPATSEKEMELWVELKRDAQKQSMAKKLFPSFVYPEETQVAQFQ